MANTALNSVAHFHLRNGACIRAIHYLANPTERGMQESFGMMVNYRYVPEIIEQRNQLYLAQGMIGLVPVSEQDATRCAQQAWRAWLADIARQQGRDKSIEWLTV